MLRTWHGLKRREFLKAASVGAGALTMPGAAGAKSKETKPVPSYLTGYEELYAKNPRKAAIEWFREANFGMFIHYGLYSLLGRHEWVQHRQRIPVAEYAKLADKFTAEKFDADFITDLALAAGMKYVNITTRHHDSFCLFQTKLTDFNSVKSPAKRDLVGELAEACAKKGLGMFFYYSHGRDWRHAHSPARGRPDYKTRQPDYKYGDELDITRYVDFMAAQITELLTNYGAVAGIWLDGIGTTRRYPPGTYRTRQLYEMIHAAQPQVLVSYKQGLLGTEDFFAPERSKRGVNNPQNKPLELCNTLQPHGWGYIKADDGKHKRPEQVLKMLSRAAHWKANLLLNTGPLGDGAIHPEDVKTLREVGKLVAANGWPRPTAPPPPKPKKTRRKPRKQ